MRQLLALLLTIALLGLPDAATAQAAGSLIAADPVADTPAGMQAWRIRYWTSDGAGRPRQVTAMVVAPREAIPARPRDVLAWTHGAWGVANQCAPSLSLAKFWTATAGLQGIKRGYVVVAPDYPGLGSPGVHPFLVGEDTGRSTLDAVRAAGQIPGAAAGKRVALWGESQGGHAALWTAQIAARYAPDLTVVGVAAAAPPTDLVANLRQSPNKTVVTMFTAFIGYSWASQYQAPLSTLGGPQTQGIINRLAKNNCISLEAKPRLGTIVGLLTLQNRLKNKDLGTIQPWAQLARLNSPTTTPFGTPMLIGQNPKDELIASAVTRAHVRALCRNGARLKFVSISGSGHVTSAKDSAGVTLQWIADRFAGRPAPRDCSGV